MVSSARRWKAAEVITMVYRLLLFALMENNTVYRVEALNFAIFEKVS